MTRRATYGPPGLPGRSCERLVRINERDSPASRSRGPSAAGSIGCPPALINARRPAARREIEGESRHLISEPDRPDVPEGPPPTLDPEVGDWELVPEPAAIERRGGELVVDHQEDAVVPHPFGGLAPEGESSWVVEIVAEHRAFHADRMGYLGTLIPGPGEEEGAGVVGCPCWSSSATLSQPYRSAVGSVRASSSPDFSAPSLEETRAMLEEGDAKDEEREGRPGVSHRRMESGRSRTRSCHFRPSAGKSETSPISPQ